MMMRNIVCSVGVLSTLMFAVPAMAQNTAPLQGNWLGNGCFGQGGPFAVSYSIHGNSTTLHGMITNKYNIPMDSTAPASYRRVGNQTELLSETKSKNFKFVLRTTSEAGTLLGTMNGIKIELNRGPVSSLQQYYNAYANSCD